MSETFSAEQHHNFERQDRRDLRALSFSELQEFSREVAELARISFRKIENGYENVNGQGVWIGPIGEDWYKVSSLSSEIKEFQPRGQGNLIL